MRVALGNLAKTGLETRVGPDIPAAVNTALVYYVGKLNSGRGPAKFPKFLSAKGNAAAGQGAAGDAEGAADGDAPSAGARPEIEVAVDERIEAAIFTDAERQGVAP